MKKKRSGLIILSEKLLKLAPTLAVDSITCLGFLGEPKLPKKLNTK